MIRQALAAYLLGQTSVTNLVGTRIRPVFLSQDDVYPAITYRRRSSGHDPGIDGGDDLPSPRFEVVSWARTYEDAVAIAEAVRAVLEDCGPNETWSFAGGSVEVEATTYIDEEDVFAEDVEGGDKPIFGVLQFYEIAYQD